MRTVWKPSYTVALVCVLIGFMLAIQYRSIRASESRSTVRRPDDLLAAYLAVEQQRAQLRAELQTLKESLQRNQDDALRKELQLAAAEAGLVPIQGPGLTVTIKSQGAGPILDEDIWKVINELKAAGAEGIAINNYRVTSRTSIRYDGVQLLIDRKPLLTPVVVKAVGDPRTLEAALNLRGGPVARLASWLTIDIQREDQIMLPAREEAPLTIAKPVKP